MNQEHPSMVMATYIIEKFENLLEKHGIQIPSNERTGIKSEAPIYSTPYAELQEEVAELLRANCKELR